MYRVFGNMTGFFDKEVEGDLFLFLVRVVYLNVFLFLTVVYCFYEICYVTAMETIHCTTLLEY